MLNNTAKDNSGKPDALKGARPVWGWGQAVMPALHHTLMLMMQDHSDNRWLTFNQAKEAGYKIKKGEHGTPVQFWQYTDQVNKIDPVTGNPELGANGKPIKVEVDLEKPRVKVFTVFNATQIEGIPPLEVKPLDWDPHERAEKILGNCGVTIKHDQRDRAFYSPMFDEIHLPPKEQFPSAEKYYDAALHEVAHSTGHESRLNRDLKGQATGDSYAREELVAAISSMMTCATLGIEQDPNRNAAYVNSWVKELTNHPMAICQAAQQADRATHYILSREHEQTLDQQQEATQAKMPRWEGTLEVRACQENEQGELISHGVEASEAQFFGVYARLADGTEQRLAVHDTQEEARDYAADLEAQRKMDERTAAMASPVAEITYINVPYEERIEARKLGAEFDSNAKSWYIPDGVDAQALTDKWPQHDPAVTRAEQQSIRDERAAVESESRMYINVPKAEKEEAKELGARWDRDAVSWYVPEGVNPDPLTSKWPRHNPEQGKDASWEPPVEEKANAQQKSEAKPTIPREERRYLTVPFKEKNEAKAAGAQWDGQEARWYAGPKADMEKLSKWLQEKQPALESNLTPREEFAAILKSIGAEVEGPHPIMDGKRHEIAVKGDKQGEMSGSYISQSDGKPAGHVINSRTKEERQWVATGHSMTDQERDILRQAAVEKLQTRQERIDKTHEKTAAVLQERVAKQKPPKEPTSYMQDKGIGIHEGIHASGKTTCVPAYDVSGKIKSMQYIQEDGSKTYAKNSERKGTFHAVGGLDELKKAPVIIIASDYATAATIKEATGRPVVAALDSGNLMAVAKALKEALPDKPIIIAGDNNRESENKTDGKDKKLANAAAKAVSGKAVFPTFASGEADRDPKGFTNFNDLANKSILGKEAVKSQMGVAIETQIEKAAATIEKTKKQEKTSSKSKGQER